MRHTFGLILGVILTPVLAYGSAWGYSQAGASVDVMTNSITDRSRLYGSFALLAAVGLVIAIVIVSRWASPLVSLVPAVVLLAWTAYFLAEPAGALRLSDHLPPTGELDGGLRALLGYGIFGLLGFALLVPSGAPGRWGRESGERRRRRTYDTFD